MSYVHPVYIAIKTFFFIYLRLLIIQFVPTVTPF